MFYDHDILSRRKTGLGVVWLAATLGKQSVVRRLTRKDFLAVNISKACTMVHSPSEPMALRLSSQLLYGVVTIYRHQAELWMQDVSITHGNIRRQIITDPIHNAIDMPKSSLKSLDAITMRLDLTFFALDFDQEALLYYDTFNLRDTTPSSGTFDGFRTPTPVSDRYVASEEQITLPNRYFDDEVGVGRQREEEFTTIAFGDEYQEDEEYDGLDLGLDLTMTHAAQFPEGVQGNLETQPHRPGDGSDFFGDSTGEWPDSDARTMQESMPMNLELGTGAFVTPARRPFLIGEEEAEIEALVGPAKRRLRPSPRLNLFEDIITELTTDQLRTSRQDYEERMDHLREVKFRKHAARAGHQFAQQRIFGPPSDMRESQLLGHLWDITIGASFDRKVRHYRRLRTDAQKQKSQSGLFAYNTLTPLQSDSEGDFDGAFDDLGVPRAADEHVALEPRGPRDSLPWNMYMAQRRRSSLMPSVSYDRAPFEREDSPLDFAIEQAAGTPFGLRSKSRLRESPLMPNRFGTPSTAAGFDEFLFPVPGTPSVEGFRLNSPLQLVKAQNSPVPVARPMPLRSVSQYAELEEDLRQETRNFLEYSFSVRNELADPRGFLFFSDLAPVASSMPEVAAQAFYHTLALASNGTFNVKQGQAYQEIQIAIV